MILGDFNSNMLTLNPESSIMSNFISSNSLRLIDHGITHTLPNSSSHIDLCLADENDVISNYETSINPFILNHHLISVSIKLFAPIPTKSSFSYRKIDQINKTVFTNSLLSHNWSEILEFDNPNSILKEFENRINIALDKTAPLITVIKSQT